MLLSGQRKSYTIKLNSHTSGMKSLQNGILYCSFVAIKLDSCLFMSKTMTCVVYVDDLLFWERSQYDIDNIMKSFKEDGPIYNWDNSKGDSVSELLVIEIKKLDAGGFQFCQNGLIRKVLEET